MPTPNEENKPQTLAEVLPYLQAKEAAAAVPAQGTVDIPPAATPETAPAATEQPAIEQPTNQPQTPAAQPVAAAATPEAITLEAANRTAEKLAAMQQENAILKAQLQQQSQAAEQKIEETLTPPVLDLTNLSYLSDEERSKQTADYANKMAEYVKKSIDPSLKPVVDAFAKQKQQAEEQVVIADLKQKTPDFEKSLPNIQAFLGSNIPAAAAVNQLPTRDKLIIAYAISKGLESMNPAQQTPEQIAEEVYANPDVMRTLELKRNAALKQNQNVPAQAASSGMANIPVTVQKQPQTIQEAGKMVWDRWGK